MERLWDETYSLLARGVHRQKLVLKAPTGAGKTVMMGAYLRRIATELPSRTELSTRRVAYVWIAPGHLHLQSYEALRAYFRDTRTVRTVQFSDTTSEKRLRPNDLLFLNWQSISSENNVLVRENEQQHDLYSLVQQTRLHDTEVIVILDEAHLFATRGDKANKVLQKLQAVIEVDVSATPLFQSDYQVVVRREEVVRAEMIKRGVVLNPALDASAQNGQALNVVLLKQALARREQLATAYAAAGTRVKPLLLIQLPSEGPKESALDRTTREAVVAYLSGIAGITTQNGRLAIWLAGAAGKVNLAGIEELDSPVEVLLFKQAIALGWDCPRAAVLLVFRELQQESFSIQTVGRILRMPEQRHYTDEQLNLGYVYTDLSRDLIRIEQDSANYLSLQKAERRDDYGTLRLLSEHVANQRAARNRLGSTFRRILWKAAEELWGISTELRDDGQTPYAANTARLRERLVELDVARVDIVVPADVRLDAVEVTAVAVDQEHRQRFAKTPEELQLLLRRYFRTRCGDFAPAESTPVLEMGLLSLLDEYLQLDEVTGTKVLLHPQNQLPVDALIDFALLRYTQAMELKRGSNVRTVEPVEWDVPAVEFYNELHQEHPAIGNILQPSYLRRRADGNWGDSGEEVRFIQFLESAEQAPHVRWWYRNGSGTRSDFSVAYRKTEGGAERWAPFFVDFVVQFANGMLGLFDTKTVGFDEDAVAKHNALHAWVEKRNARLPGSTVGGILIRQDTLWKYSPAPIVSEDTLGWVVLQPGLVGK